MLSITPEMRMGAAGRMGSAWPRREAGRQRRAGEDFPEDIRFEEGEVRKKKRAFQVETVAGE